MTESQELSITDELQLLEKDYTMVAMTVLASLKDKQVPSAVIYQYITELPQQVLKPKYKRLIAKFLSKEISIDQLFVTFSPYCDFLNPDLLEQIVERFADEISAMIITIYLKRLRDFRRRTRLCNLTGKWIGITPPGYVELVLEMEEVWSNKTMEDLEVFRSYLPRTQWFLKKVDKEGSEVVFSVPKGVWVYQEDLQNLSKNNILRLKEKERSVVILNKEQLDSSQTGRMSSQSPSTNDDRISRDWDDGMGFALNEEIQFGFHRQAGENVFVSRSAEKAMLVDIANGPGIVYGSCPLKGLSEFEVKLLDYFPSVRGSLKIGIMRHKANYSTSLVSIPKLSEHRDNSCMFFRSQFKEKNEFQNNFGGVHLLRYYGVVDLSQLRKDDHVGMQLSYNGDLRFFVNGISQGLAAEQVYGEGFEVYCFLELAEGYKSVEITRAVIKEQKEDSCADMQTEALEEKYITASQDTS